MNNQNTLNAYVALVEKAQSLLASYLPPDGISQDQLINGLIGLFDGPEQRAARDLLASPLLPQQGGEQAAIECYGIYRTRDDEGGGQEYFHSALWHSETAAHGGDRIVKGRFVPDTAVLPQVGDAKSDSRLLKDAKYIASKYGMLNPFDPERLAQSVIDRIDVLLLAAPASSGGAIADIQQDTLGRLFFAPVGLWGANQGLPAGSIERLRIHAADKANTAFARSTMRELLDFLTTTSGLGEAKAVAPEDQIDLESQFYEADVQSAEKIIADYKAHYDFPAQGESHMHDCITDYLGNTFFHDRAPVAQALPVGVEKPDGWIWTDSMHYLHVSHNKPHRNDAKPFKYLQGEKA